MTDLDKLSLAAEKLDYTAYPDLAAAVREAIAELRGYREDEDNDYDDLDDDDFDEDEGENDG